MTTNFAQPESYEPQLARLGLHAEKYFFDDANSALLKARQVAESLAQSVSAHPSKSIGRGERQFDLLYKLRDDGLLPGQPDHLFHEIREIGNQANSLHFGLGGNSNFRNPRRGRHNDRV